MNSKGYFNSLLVPVDFSEASGETFKQAVNLSGGDEPSVIVLHIIEEALIDLMSDNELGDRDELISTLRDRTEKQLAEFATTDQSVVQVTRIVSVGRPFLEIIRKSEDFDVDAIVMGKVGTGDQFEKLLFGSTAERVLRGSKRPVFVFPRPANTPDANV